MDVVLVVILFIFASWLIIYRIFSAKIEAACDRIKSKGFRNTMKVFLKVTYVVSIIVVMVGYVAQIASLFSNKNSKS